MDGSSLDLQSVDGFFHPVALDLAGPQVHEFFRNGAGRAVFHLHAVNGAHRENTDAVSGVEGLVRGEQVVAREVRLPYRDPKLFSPDREAYVFAKNHNLYFVEGEDVEDAIQLTEDGDGENLSQTAGRTS